MKAAVLTRLNSPLEIKQVELTDLKIGQVKVKVLLSGLCGAQLQEISGLKGNSKFLPHLLGHEGSGIVKEIGPGVTRVKVGDKVVMHWRVGKGIESPFPSYVMDGKPMSSGKITTLSEYSIVSENRLTPVPQDTPDHLCAMLGCGITTALGTINNDAKVKFGESVMVVGCGGVGLNLIQGAKLASAYPVIAVDITDEKRELAIQMGASRFINVTKEDLTGMKVDVIVSTIGNTETFSKTITLLSETGRYILVGQPKPGDTLSIPNANDLFGGEGKVLMATQCGKTEPNGDIQRYVKLHKAGILNIDSIVTHQFDLDDVNEAFDVLRSGVAGRVMVKMGNERGSE